MLSAAGRVGLRRGEHPHIVRVYEVDEAEGAYYIAMQYIAGGSLAQRLEPGRSWPLARVLALAEQVAQALDYAHGQGVLHLDLKPGNILLEGDPLAERGCRAWLADFGLGRAAGSASLPPSAWAGGTPAYMAPEQADLETPRAVTHLADLYALGVVLYQLCTGRVPFEGNLAAVAAAHVYQQPPRPTLLNGELSQAVEDVLLRVLAKVPAARFPDGAGLVAALAEAARASQARPAVRRVMTAEPLVLGDLQVHTLRQLAQACDSAWEEALERLYDGGLEAWLTKIRALAAAAEANRIRQARGKARGPEREKGLEEFLNWTGYVADPVLAVQPEVVDFGAEEKGYGYRLQAVLTVQNAGRGLLWGEVRALAPWLTVVEGSSFTVRAGGRHEAVLEANVDALPNGCAQIAEAVAVQTQVGERRVGVRIEVLGPVVHIEPRELDFGQVQGGEEVVRRVVIANRGQGALEGTARAEVSGLEVTPERFRVAAARAQTLEVRARAGRPWISFSGQQPAVLLETNEGTHRIPVRIAGVRQIVLPKFEWVRVPAGEFLMGSDKAKDPGAYDHELPQHRVRLSEYWIGKYPVTNAQYRVFVEATGRTPPGHWEGGKVPAGLEDHPVVHVSWEDAAAFCGWLGVRLPTEAEWEKAARGVDGRIYPWGDEWDASKANTSEAWVGGTTPVGAYPAGASPYGALDMAGNVWEWVADWYGERYYSESPDGNPLGPASGSYRVVRGGSWVNYQRNARVANRNGNTPDSRYDIVGFRCARSG